MKKKYQQNYLNFIVCSILFGTISSAYAQENKAITESNTTTDSTDTPSATLETITITAKKGISKKSEEVTGLGKTVKTAEEISQKQILSIRDLVKDTPGVAVVEQGRGASSGYTIRGVDKNRVAVTVDGLNQAQSYLVQKRQIGEGREGSGAINEIELENISAVQISQGANGSESGSGALGGAVSFRTKNVSDVLDRDSKFSTFYKGSYASRDKQTMHSAGFALRNDKADLLLQYTDRTKQAVIPHKDILNTEYGIWRWGSTADDFKNGNIVFDKYKFIVIDECPNYETNLAGCTPKQKVLSKPVFEKMNAKDYTGTDQVLGDPMDYKSGSYLFKLGYNIAPSHRIQGIYENTKQQYNTQDISKARYHLVDSTGIGVLGASRGIYRNNRYHEGLYTSGDEIAGYWSQARFIDEKHAKNRIGLSYHFKNIDKTGLLDDANISFDHQTVNINNFVTEKYCSEYPTIDKNCVAGIDKPNSAEKSNRTLYEENHNVLRADFSKFIKGNKISHKLLAGVGANKFKSTRSIADIHEKFYKLNYDFVGDKDDVQIWSIKPPTLTHNDVCKNQQFGLGEARKCGDSVITGYNLYTSLKDTIYFGDLADLSLGLRYDNHKFDSDDSWTGRGKYSNTSWNVGLLVRPTDYLDVMYRASSGYRVPSFKELFGYRLDGLAKGQDDDKYEATNVRPEKALNQEFGVTIKGNAGSLDVSYFDNRYTDLIDLTLKQFDRPAPNLPVQIWGYRNYQDVHLDGVSIGGKLYFDSLSDKLPQGLTGRLAYLKTNVKENKIKGNFVNAEGYFLDTISPTRYVFGVDYTADNDKWGLGLDWTITAPKNTNELKTNTQTPDGKTTTKQATKAKSQGWNTLDLSAFYRPSKYITVRGSLKNALNYRYSTWEALRQTSITSGNAHEQGTLRQYASPGRNFVVSVEMKY